MSWASVMEHVTFGLALCTLKKIARKHCAKSARISALGYGAVKGKEENQEAPYACMQQNGQ